MGLAEASAEKPEGSRKDAERWTGKLVEARMVEAMDYLKRTSPSGRNPFAKDGPWGAIIADVDVVQQTADAPADYDEKMTETIGEMFDRVTGRVRRVFKAGEVDRHEQALDWIAHVPAKGQMRALVGVVLEQKTFSRRVDWADVKRALGRGDSADMLRMTYTRAMARVAETLNAQGLAIIG